MNRTCCPPEQGKYAIKVLEELRIFDSCPASFKLLYQNGELPLIENRVAVEVDGL